MPVHLRELLAKPSGVKEDNRLKLLRALMISPDIQANLSKRAGLSPATARVSVMALLPQHADGPETGDNRRNRTAEWATKPRSVSNRIDHCRNSMNRTKPNRRKPGINFSGVSNVAA